MKHLVATTVLLFSQAAFAGGYGTSSSYDWQSGNSYSTTHNYDGSHTVHGTNLNTGSSWTTTISPNGDMRGIDSNLNSWSYDSGTGAYQNSNGHGCIGTGYARSCW